MSDRTLPAHWRECERHGFYTTPTGCPRCREAADLAHDNPPSPKVSLPEPEQQPLALARDRAGEAPGAGCPAVIVTHRRVKLLDVDAKYSACKNLIDGIAKAGWIRGDREGEITLEVRQEKVPHYKDEEVIVEIEQPDGPSVVSA